MPDGRSCPTRTAPALNGLGLREVTDTVRDPYLPTVWLLTLDLTVHRWWILN
jgi:hypothetical protein